MFKKNTISYKILAVFLSAIISASIGFIIVRAGASIDSPGDPSSAGRMYTLENIYDYLTEVDSAVPTKPTGAFANPSAGPGSTMHDLDDIFATLTRLPATGQTTSYGTADDDGDYQSGATLRYSTTDVSGEIIVNDLNTGLMWEQKTAGNKTTAYNWENAKVYCEDQIGTTGTYAGYSDWRLPNIKELFLIVKHDAGIGAPYIDRTYFPNTQSSYNYWSSTTDPSFTDFALLVRFGSGAVGNDGKASTYFVRCVRGQ